MPENLDAALGTQLNKVSASTFQALAHGFSGYRRIRKAPAVTPWNQGEILKQISEKNDKRILRVWRGLQQCWELGVGML